MPCCGKARKSFQNNIAKAKNPTPAPTIFPPSEPLTRAQRIALRQERIKRRAERIAARAARIAARAERKNP